MKNIMKYCIEENKKELKDMAKELWEKAEVSNEEYFACKIQKEYLKEKDFKIEDVKNVETAFIATFGNEGPVIGILGEYDALPGLGEDGKPGHGCGHNLLGVAGIGAVIALKEAMEKENIKGTIKYFGCPAEEAGNGKVDMWKNGCFKDIDCALSWHPFDVNATWRSSSLSSFSVKFRFKGVTSHAAQAPHNGRSALDAVELMNVGANYLREHIIDSIRMHYVITNGGERPNIVPGSAESWYYIRGEKASDAKAVLDRLIKVAKGASMMTETEVEYEVINAIYDYMPNQYLTDIVAENMKLVGAPKFNEKDISFAKELCDSFTKEERLGVSLSFQGDKKIVDKYLHDEVIDFKEYKYKHLAGSTDTGDVSYMVPTAQFAMAAWPIGTAAHTWQSCSASGANIGFEAMINAAKVLAYSAYDIIVDKEKIKIAKEEHKSSLDNFKYKPLV